MTDVASRELRNNTRALLERVDAGELLTITVDGRAVAELHPVSHRRQWMSRAEFVNKILPNQADNDLLAELKAIAPDNTDDLRPL